MVYSTSVVSVVYQAIEDLLTIGVDNMSKRHSGPDPENIPHYVDWGASVSRTYRDLCSTCNHTSICGTRSTPQRPILFCEEFDAFLPIPTSAAGKTVSPKPPGRQDAARYKGLCVNCENRETCTTHKDEGGIWHCEEYR